MCLIIATLLAPVAFAPGGATADLGVLAGEGRPGTSDLDNTWYPGQESSGDVQCPSLLKSDPKEMIENACEDMFFFFKKKHVACGCASFCFFFCLALASQRRWTLEMRKHRQWSIRFSFSPLFVLPKICPKHCRDFSGWPPRLLRALWYSLMNWDIFTTGRLGWGYMGIPRSLMGTIMINHGLRFRGQPLIISLNDSVSVDHLTTSPARSCMDRRGPSVSWMDGWMDRAFV